MGYTHYWNNLGKLHNQVTWNKFVEDCKVLRKKLPENIKLVDELFDSETIVFNGVDEEGHETFNLRRQPKDFDFCKTARKPYDLLVCGCLILYQYYFPKEVIVSSDGDLNDEWKHAFDFVQQTLPHGKGLCTELLLDGSFLNHA